MQSLTWAIISERLLVHQEVILESPNNNIKFKTLWAGWYNALNREMYLLQINIWERRRVAPNGVINQMANLMDQTRIFNYASSKNKLKLISRSDHQIILIVSRILFVSSFLDTWRNVWGVTLHLPCQADGKQIPRIEIFI